MDYQKRIAAVADGMHHRSSRLFRSQGFVNIPNGTSKQLIGPNDKREALIISAPPGSITDQSPQSQSIFGADTSTAGTKLGFAIPVGFNAILQSATFVETAGTGVVAKFTVQYAAGETTIFQATTQGQFVGNISLTGGQVVRWDVVTAIAASTSDFTMNILVFAAGGRCTLSFGQPAVLDTGINLHPGPQPFILFYEDIGDAFREEVNAIMASGPQNIGFVDIFRA